MVIKCCPWAVGRIKWETCVNLQALPLTVSNTMIFIFSHTLSYLLDHDNSSTLWMKKLSLREVHNLPKVTRPGLSGRAQPQVQLLWGRRDLLGPYHLISCSSFTGRSAHILCHSRLALPTSTKPWCAPLWHCPYCLYLHLVSAPSGMRNSPWAILSGYVN